MITGELLLMFQTPHNVAMGDFCEAIESCSGMGIKNQKFLTRAFTQNAVEYSKFWASCTSVEYWVTEQEQLATSGRSDQVQVPDQPAVHVGSSEVAQKVTQNVAEAYCLDLDLKEAILRSQNAVAEAKKLQGKWRLTMDEMHRRWDGKIKHSVHIV